MVAEGRQFPTEIWKNIMSYVPHPIKRPRHANVIKQLIVSFKRYNYTPVSHFYFWWATTRSHHIRWEYKTKLGTKFYVFQWATQSRILHEVAAQLL